MRKLLRSSTILFFVALLVFGWVGEHASARQVLRFAHVQQTDHAYHLMAERFKEELEKRLPDVEVQIFPAGQLGNERDLLEALQIGSVDISTITSALTSGFVPAFSVFSLPFLFDDFDHMYAVMDSPIGDRLAEELEKAGFVKLGYVSGGSRSMYARRPVQSLPDLRGMKIRTMEDPTYVETWNALGALATPVPWGDVYLSLQQGIVDGAEGALISYQSMGFYDPAPHVTVINYVFSWHNFMMSKRTWDRLSPEVQAAVKEAADIAAQWEREYVKQWEEELLDVLKNEHGATIIFPEDMEEWRKAVQVIYEQKADQVGGLELIEAIRNTR